MEHFYARLFVCHPEIRSMFPHAMHDHMERVFDALARIVWHIDNPDSLVDYLSQLGRGHRKFGVKERHYEPFLTVLAETVRHFNSRNWTAKTQAAWDAALARVSAGMLAAAERDAALQPPWWVGEVVQHDLRRPDLAVLTIKPDQPLRYTPGQYVAVQVPRWPRVWRNFSIANAPRENGLIDLHVRGVRGGMVSGSLVHNTRPGDTRRRGHPPAVRRRRHRARPDQGDHRGSDQRQQAGAPPGDRAVLRGTVHRRPVRPAGPAGPRVDLLGAHGNSRCRTAGRI
jgi:hemoglobin-like flavoprotein